MGNSEFVVCSFGQSENRHLTFYQTIPSVHLENILGKKEKNIQ